MQVLGNWHASLLHWRPACCLKEMRSDIQSCPGCILDALEACCCASMNHDPDEGVKVGMAHLKRPPYHSQFSPEDVSTVRQDLSAPLSGERSSARLQYCWTDLREQLDGDNISINGTIEGHTTADQHLIRYAFTQQAPLLRTPSPQSALLSHWDADVLLEIYAVRQATCMHDFVTGTHARLATSNA